MLQVTKTASAEEHDPGEPQTASPAELVGLIFGVLRRHLLLILSVSLLAITLALSYLAVAPARFTAVATLLIDRGKVQPFAQQQQVYVDSPIDSAAIESQIQIFEF